jgi:hypothetical protein
MAIRVKHVVNVFISDDTAGLLPLFGTTETSREEVIVDAFDRCVSGNLSIAASGTESLPLGDIDDPRGFYIDADRGFNMILNGGAEVIQVRPAVDPTTSGAGTRAKFFIEADLSAVSITNADASSVLVAKYAVWGDLTP